MVRNIGAYKKVVINDVNPVTFTYMMTTEVEGEKATRSTARRNDTRKRILVGVSP